MAGRKITFSSTHASGDGQGWIFDEQIDGKAGLIVVHEWWGMNDQIIKVGKQIAEDGKFVVLVPDMYRGKVATDHEHAGHLSQNLDWDGAIKDLEGAAKHLMELGCKKVGITGFCMGGALALANAVSSAHLVSAAAPFYGIPRDRTKFDLTTLKIPVQGHFGIDDNIKGFSAKEDYDALNELLKPTGFFELFEYQAGHAFANPFRENYVPEAANLAMKRLFEFMHKHLD